MKFSKISYKVQKSIGFTLVELMIVVAIVSILAGIAIPIYGRYVRKSRTSEAIGNLGAIAMFEETFFSENDSYVTASPNPSGTVPSPSDGGGRKLFSSSISGWSLLGRVVPDGTPLYFQYAVQAGQYDSGGTAVTGGVGSLVSNTATFTPGSTGGVCSGMQSLSANSLGIPTTASSNWFYVTAVGNQKQEGSGNKCSLFIKVIDRPDIYKENEIE